MKKKVLAIVGPTAVGKTALSIQLAQRFNGEIISGDAFQVYRGLNIGTAKITQAEMQGIKHHLIDIREVTDSFSVSDFQMLGREAIKEITSRGKLPIVVGGTGYYLKALLANLSLGGLNEEKAQVAAKPWEKFLAEQGEVALWQVLKKLDPNSAAIIPATNTRRTIRALTVISGTGKLFSNQPKTTNEWLFDFLAIGLTTERSKLYERINQRVLQMVDAGLFDEAKQLYKQKDRTIQAQKGIGYKECFPYFVGEISKEEAITQIQTSSRHYAKRQLTWFRHQLPVSWYDLLGNPETEKAIKIEINEWLQN